MAPSARATSTHFLGRDVLFAFSRYSARLHHGVARAARQFGWHLNAEMAYANRIPQSWRGDGIVCLLDRDDALVRFVRRAGVPAVDLASFRPEIPLPRVVGDQARVGALAAQHLLERHFRHFAWYSGDRNLVVQARMEGFVAALRAAGAACRAWTPPRRRRPGEDPWTAKRRFLLAQLRAAPKPLGVFAFHDGDAVHVLDACRLGGLSVPDEVAIVGVDNDPLVCETVHVPLSSVNHDLERIGYEGACLLQRLMDGARPPRHPLVIPPRGVTARRSTDGLAVADPLVRAALVQWAERGRRLRDKQALATAVGTPLPALERAVRDSLGRSLTTELAAMRLRRARTLLVDTRLPIADVAAEAGFSSPHYFDRVFRRATGSTPLRYRRQNQPPRTA